MLPVATACRVCMLYRCAGVLGARCVTHHHQGDERDECADADDEEHQQQQQHQRAEEHLGAEVTREGGGVRANAAAPRGCSCHSCTSCGRPLVSRRQGKMAEGEPRAG